MGSQVLLDDPWTAHRQRATGLCEAQPHAAEMLRLYLALSDVWTEVVAEATATPPQPSLAEYAAERSMPRVVQATMVAGPAPVREAVMARFHEIEPVQLISGWLRGDTLPAADRFLARASTAPLLEAFPELARATGSAAKDARHCPNCGGPPQLSFIGLSEEALVSAPRRLLCSRCAGTWTFPRMVCAGCGNEETARMPIYSDHERFAHLRIDACEVCRGYLVTVDLPKDPKAVPAIDELVALPLDLYAREQGFEKITPNLMGF